MAGHALDVILGRGRALLVAAARLEADAILGALGIKPDPPLAEWTVSRLDDRLDLLLTGIGKANAAGATADAITGRSYACVVNLGVCGSLPRLSEPPLPPGAVIVATESVFADEGVETPSGFEDVASMGFGPLTGAPGDGLRLPGSRALRDAIHPLAEVAAPIATVSMCSGTDALAGAIADRSGAVAEAMEGAAIALVCARRQTPFIELRVVSNTTGDRARQQWNIRAALERLGGVAARL